MATNVGTIEYLISIDTKSLKGELKAVDDKVKGTAGIAEKDGSKGFLKMGAAMGVVAGIAGSVVTKAIDAVSNSIGNAVSRVDTMNNFPRVMSNLGISAEESQKTIKALDKGLQGLPTPINDAALSVQRFTSASGNIGKSTDLFLSLNNAILAGGAPMQNQQAALEQFTQAFSKGKFELIEWRSLQQAMPAQLKQVATAMGYVSDSDLYDALSNGTVTMEQFTDQIITMNKKGGGAFASFEEQAKGATSGIATGWANFQTALTRGVASIINTLGSENISKAIGSIGKAFETALKYVAAFISYVQDNPEVLYPLLAIVTAITPALGLLGIAILLVRDNWQRIKPVIDQIVQSFKVFWELIKPLRDFIADQFKKAWEDIKKAFDDVKKSLEPFLPQLKILGIILGVGILVPLVAIGAAITAVIAGFVVFAVVVGRVIGVVSQAQAAFTSFISQGIRGFDDLWNVIWNFASRAAGTILGLFRDVGAAVGNVIGNAFRSVVNNIIFGVIGTINRFIRDINGIIGAVNQLPGPDISSLRELGVPQLAEGGIVSRPTLAMIGEGGESEAVIPLSKFDEMFGEDTKGSSNKPQIVQNFYPKDEIDMNVVNRKLTWELNRA